MSIIYDALQKTQKIRGNKQSVMTIAKSVSFVKWRPRVIYFLFLCTSVAMIFTYYPQMKLIVLAYSSQKPVKQPFNTAEYRTKHILNGVFLSNQETIALINNKMFHLGDIVDGMKIIAINEQGVRLSREDSILLLKVL